MTPYLQGGGGYYQGRTSALSGAGANLGIGVEIGSGDNRWEAGLDVRGLLAEDSRFAALLLGVSFR